MKKLKGYLLGFLSAALLFGGVSAFAVNTTTLYDVLTNGITIVVDGQKLNPTDVNGNKVEPIIYNGTTYLPVRAVANSIGKPVYWDGPNYTVYLGDMDGKLEYPTVELENMVSIEDDVKKTTRLIDNYGNRYGRAVIRDGIFDYSLQYLLNMKYSRFKGTLYVPEGEKGVDASFLTIVADGTTIYTSPEMTKASAPVSIDANITGYNDVRLQFNTATVHNVNLCLGDAGFYQ